MKWGSNRWTVKKTTDHTSQTWFGSETSFRWILVRWLSVDQQYQMMGRRSIYGPSFLLWIAHCFWHFFRGKGSSSSTIRVNLWKSYSDVLTLNKLYGVFKPFSPNLTFRRLVKPLETPKVTLGHFHKSSDVVVVPWRLGINNS